MSDNTQPSAQPEKQDTEQPKIGWYSEKAACMYGTVFWSTPGGGEVEITCATADPEGYKWDDRVNMGPVVAPLNRGRAGREKFQKNIELKKNVLDAGFSRYPIFKKL